MALPFRIRHAEWFAGALVVAVAAVIVVAFVLVVRVPGVFVEHHRYSVTMSEGFGIAPGGSVEMLGIEVGHVDAVEITDDNRVQVRFDVDETFARRLGEDSVARVKMSLGLQTMLGGVALVLTPGSADAPRLPNGAEVPIVEPSKLTDLLPAVGGDQMIADLEGILANTRVLTDEMTQPDSELRRLLVDVSLLVGSLQRGEGTVGELLKDDAALYHELTATLAAVEVTLKRVDGMMGKSGKLIQKSDAMITSSSALLTKTDAVVVDAGKAFKKMDPVMNDAGDAMGTLNESVASFGKTTRELSAVLKKMDRVVDDIEDITRATKRIGPVRRHLDDKNTQPLVDGPTR